MKTRQVTVINPKEKGQRIVTLKPARNAKCQCGSGKKQKNCCGSETRFFSIPQVGKAQLN